MDCCRRCCHHIYMCTAPRVFLTKLPFTIFCSSPIFRNLKRMRKTRLVILPTKCLHQMGFLLLFLSCPVIGDWGRIRPESENSHNAIQIDREGSYGFERDPPGGLVDFLNENGSQRCRLSEDSDSITPENKPVEVTQPKKFAEMRNDVRRVVRTRNEQSERMSERRILNERAVRKTIQRRLSDERDVRKVHQRDTRKEVRSRSVESRRSSNRNDVKFRSLSLNRMGNERMSRIIRQNGQGNLRRESERLLLTRRLSERQNERRVEQQRRIARGESIERREKERNIQSASERREKETIRFGQSAERQNLRRDINRSSIREQSMRRENDMTRRQVRDGAERRLSLASREQNDAKRMERIQIRRDSDQKNLKRRVPEIRNTRSLDSAEVDSARTIRFNNRREAGSERFVSLPSKVSERNIRERVGLMYDRVEGIKSRRLTEATAPRTRRDASEADLSAKKAKDDNLFDGIAKWMDLKIHHSYTAGDWTTNCVIGAVLYFFTTRQIKTV